MDQATGGTLGVAMLTAMSAFMSKYGPRVAVGGLVAVNVVLIGALVLRDPVRTATVATPVPASASTMSPGDTTPTPGRTPSQSRSASPSDGTSPATTSPSPTPSPSASSPPSSTSGDRPRLLAASSGRVAWRAESADCDGSAVVQVTTDAGRSWSDTDPGLSAIVRLSTYGDEAAFAVGADSNCRTTYAWISGPKDKWQRDRSRVQDMWFRTPKDPDRVHAPGGDESRPCGDRLVDLAGMGTFQAAALCADGRVRTAAEGRPWRTVQERSGALSLNADDTGFFAAISRNGCSGLLIQRFDTDGVGLDGGTRGTCQSEAKPVPGETVVAQRFDRLWFWSGDRVTTSS